MRISGVQACVTTVKSLAVNLRFDCDLIPGSPTASWAPINSHVDRNDEEVGLVTELGTNEAWSAQAAVLDFYYSWICTLGCIRPWPLASMTPDHRPSYMPKHTNLVQCDKSCNPPHAPFPKSFESEPEIVIPQVQCNCYIPECLCQIKQPGPYPSSNKCTRCRRSQIYRQIAYQYIRAIRYACYYLRDWMIDYRKIQCH